MISTYLHLVDALAAVKEVAASANEELGLPDRKKAQAIVAACREIRNGHLHDQRFVDMTQGGAGTSTSMNTNEVIANRVLKILGHSTSDDYLTVVDVAAIVAVPMTLGQEFSTYAVMLEEDRDRLAEAVSLVHEINRGAPPPASPRRLSPLAVVSPNSSWNWRRRRNSFPG